ncbi:MAG: hypothetical protein ACLTLQ_11850 [[Clostridium] scindens]
MNLYVPIFIVVLSNTLYHICAKSTPDGINTFASLSISYTVGAVASVLMYFLTQKNADLIAEYRHLNWSSFALGLSVVGLEAGFILMYKAGWNISTAQIVQSVILAVVLIFVGCLLYKEIITVQKNRRHPYLPGRPVSD